MSGQSESRESDGRFKAIAPAPHRADIGIIAALPLETAELIDLLKKVRKYKAQGQTVYEGLRGDRVVTVIHSGMGRERARKAAEHLIFGHRPYWIIHPGFGGGLDACLKPADVILPTEIVNANGDLVEVPIRPELLPEGIRTGRLLTVDKILRTPDEKANWHQKTGAIAVDMESFAVADLCRSMNLRWVGLRVITDTQLEELPPEILTITGPTGAFRLGATIGALWARPSAIKDLLKLRESAQIASEKIAHYVIHLIDALPIP
ncbi:MAG: nucleoside phosphorylase [Planctomycetota bacterium]